MRPPIKPSKRKCADIRFKVTAATRKLAEQQAEEQGYTLSFWCRRIIEDALSRGASPPEDPVRALLREIVAEEMKRDA